MASCPCWCWRRGISLNPQRSGTASIHISLATPQLEAAFDVSGALDSRYQHCIRVRYRLEESVPTRAASEHSLWLRGLGVGVEAMSRELGVPNSESRVDSPESRLQSRSRKSGVETRHSEPRYQIVTPWVRSGGAPRARVYPPLYTRYLHHLDPAIGADQQHIGGMRGE
jgi:hypothetical protein